MGSRNKFTLSFSYNQLTLKIDKKPTKKMPKKNPSQTSCRPNISTHLHQQKCQAGFSNNFFYVNQILNTRTLPNGREQVYVSWQGWSARYNSWVFRDTVMTVNQMEDSRDNENGVDVGLGAGKVGLRQEMGEMGRELELSIEQSTCKIIKGEQKKGKCES